MLHLRESVRKSFRWRKRSNITIIVNNVADCHFADELQVLLQDEGKVITVIDARTLYDHKQLRQIMTDIPEGFLIIDHVTEIPDGENQDTVQEDIRWILKGDWRNAENVTYPTEWKNHLRDTALQIYAISYGETKSKVFPLGACGWMAYGPCKDDNLLRIDTDEETDQA